MLPTLFTQSRLMATMSFALMLAACSGGGGGSSDAPSASPVIPPVISTAPTITTQPANVTVAAGASAMFSVMINGGSAPITYQWKRNGSAIAGATSASYTLATTVVGDNAATFSVDVINPAGTLTSAAALLTITVPPVNGIVFSVDTTDDRVDDDINDGMCHTNVNTCSLRAALMQANHLSSALTRINIPAGTYLLTRAPLVTGGEDNGDLDIAAPLGAGQIITLAGAGASNTIIDGNQADRVINIDAGRIANISGLTIRNGRAQGIIPTGGGILNLATLTLRDCVITGNQAISGGGITSEGAITIINSTFQSNTADTAGGGLFLDGTATVRNSTVSGNVADSGGGIFGRGQLYIINSTVSQNIAYTDGGGIYTFNPGQVTALYNSTVVSNDADHDRDQNGGLAGGVYIKVDLRYPVQGRFLVVNTLITDNTLGDSPIYDDCHGALESYGMNLLSEVSNCTFSNATTWGMIAVNSIGPLQNNGGSTLTHAPAANSRAVDGSLDALGCVDETGAQLTTDQRGAPRIAGARCDIGAVEYGSVVP